MRSRRDSGRVAASGLKAYFDLVYREHDCYATWLPGTPVALGEIGRITEKGAFQRTGSFRDRLGEMPLARTVEETDQTIASSGGVSFSAGGEVKTSHVVELLAGAGASMEIAFVRNEAAAMVLEDVRHHEFRDELAARKLMRRLREEQLIDDDEVVVTWVKEARSGVIASTYDAEKGADAALNAEVGQGQLTIAKIDGKLRVARLTSSQTVAEAEDGKPLTPMYRALVFKRNAPWWKFWSKQLEIRSATPGRTFAPPGMDDGILPAQPSQVRLPAELVGD